MEEEAEDGFDGSRLVSQAAGIVASYVRKNPVDPSDMGKLITDTHKALFDLTKPGPVEEPLVPAVSIRKSVFPDYIVCLEDGLKFKTLKRHLAKLGMTPEQYREKWGLGDDYPMVAPNYAERRSTLALEFGLGRKTQEE